MSTIVDIRSSIAAQITTLTDQLAPLQAALDALGDDNGTVVSAIVVTDQESPDVKRNRAVVHAERMAMEEAKKEHPTAKRKRDRLYDLLRTKYISEIDTESEVAVTPLPNRTRMVKSPKRTGKSVAATKRTASRSIASRARGDRAREILSLHDMGCSPQEIMEETGAHPNYVYKVIRDDRNNR
jgi:hypothetical protein